MENEQTFITISAIILGVLIMFIIYTHYKLEKRKSEFQSEIQKARINIIGKQFYEQKIKNLGFELSPEKQEEFLAHIYFKINKANDDYKANPTGVPNAIDKALSEINYKYTILDNE